MKPNYLSTCALHDIVRVHPYSQLAFCCYHYRLQHGGSVPTVSRRFKSLRAGCAGAHSTTHTSHMPGLHAAGLRCLHRHDLDTLLIHNCIGKGSFGAVYRGILKPILHERAAEVAVATKVIPLLEGRGGGCGRRAAGGVTAARSGRAPVHRQGAGVLPPRGLRLRRPSVFDEAAAMSAPPARHGWTIGGAADRRRTGSHAGHGESPTAG